MKWSTYRCHRRHTPSGGYPGAKMTFYDFVKFEPNCFWFAAGDQPAYGHISEKDNKKTD
jgi:hypothetical protein